MKTLSTMTNRGSFAAALTVAAVLALMAGAKSAKAWDQQATDAEMSTELSYRAYQGLPQHHSSGAYASANRHERGFGSGVPQRDFQLEGR